MGIADFIFITIVVIVSIASLYNLWRLANKRRDDSIRDYMHEREQRKQEFANNNV